jgi:hypothetical protein
MTEKENPYQDIDDFITRVYDEETTIIKPIANQITIPFIPHNRVIPQEYLIIELLDEYVAKYKNWIPPLSDISLNLKNNYDDLFKSISSRYGKPKPKLQLIDPQKSNPHADTLRYIIRALKSRGLLEDSKGLDVKYVKLLDEVNIKTVKLEKLSKGFDAQEKKLQETEVTLADTKSELAKANQKIDELKNKLGDNN